MAKASTLCLTMHEVMILLSPPPTAIGLSLSGLLLSLCRPNTKELLYSFLMEFGMSLLSIFSNRVCTVFAYGLEEFLFSVYVTMLLSTSEMSPKGPAARALGFFEIVFMNVSIEMSLLMCLDLYFILVSYCFLFCV